MRSARLFGCRCVWVAVRAAPAVVLCLISSLAAGADEPLQPTRVPAPVYIPSGSATGAGPVVVKFNIYGNSIDQLDELVRQCGIRGVLDLGRGWKAPDPKRISEGFYSADPALDWPAFEAGPDKDGKLPALSDVVAAFFKDRRAYRFSIDKSGLVWIEPADKWRRTGWFLRREFVKPVVSDVHAEKGWVISSDDVEEAVKGVCPEWKRSRTEFYLSWKMCGLVPDGLLDVYPPRETSVSNLEEFLRLWLISRRNGYIVLEEHIDQTPPPLPCRSVNVTLDEFQPFRQQATAADLVEGLKRGAKAPKGYVWPYMWIRDCYRELERRHHFRSEEVVRSVIESDIGAELYWTGGTSEVKFFERLDKRRLGRFLRVCYLAALRRDKIKGRTVYDPPPALEEADYVRYWEHLARSDDPVLKKIGESRLRK